MAAQMLYHDIDNLELYVGLQAEEAKTPQPGAGLCPGYTVSRAILSDAVCLTRGDRFMTTEFTPQNLTAWGYADCQFDVADGSYGGMLTKLLFRTLPDCYPAGSAYAHFPFLVPSRFREEMAARDAALVDTYTWERPTPAAARAERDFPRSPAGYAARMREITGCEAYPVDTVRGFLCVGRRMLTAGPAAGAARVERQGARDASAVVYALRGRTDSQGVPRRGPQDP